MGLSHPKKSLYSMTKGKDAQGTSDDGAKRLTVLIEMLHLCIHTYMEGDSLRAEQSMTEPPRITPGLGNSSFEKTGTVRTGARIGCSDAKDVVPSAHEGASAHHQVVLMAMSASIWLIVRAGGSGGSTGTSHRSEKLTALPM